MATCTAAVSVACAIATTQGRQLIRSAVLDAVMDADRQAQGVGSNTHKLRRRALSAFDRAPFATRR